VFINTTGNPLASVRTATFTVAALPGAVNVTVQQAWTTCGAGGVAKYITIGAHNYATHYAGGNVFRLLKESMGIPDPNVPIPGLVPGLEMSLNDFTANGVVRRCDCWMVENSLEGTAAYQSYPGHASGERGYYYTEAQAAQSGNACPAGWHIPAFIENDNIASTILASEATVNVLTVLIPGGVLPYAKKWWTGTGLEPSFMSPRGGYIDHFGAETDWDVKGHWWTNDLSNNGYGEITPAVSTNDFEIDGVQANAAFPVRCVQDNGAVPRFD
jgi:uncharacterized protein (TIGR02145 family)